VRAIIDIFSGINSVKVMIFVLYSDEHCIVEAKWEPSATVLPLPDGMTDFLLSDQRQLTLVASFYCVFRFGAVKRGSLMSGEVQKSSR
jgi:hypothetical protein